MNHSVDVYSESDPVITSLVICKDGSGVSSYPTDTAGTDPLTTPVLHLGDPVHRLSSETSRPLPHSHPTYQTIP